MLLPINGFQKQNPINGLDATAQSKAYRSSKIVKNDHHLENVWGKFSFGN